MKRLFLLALMSFCVWRLAAQVPNDECNSASIIANVASLQTIAIDLTTATESLDGSCDIASNTNLDIWYSFTMPFDGRVKFTGLSVINKLSLYDQCGGTELICRAGSGFINDLLGGTTYLLRYATASQYSPTNTMSVQAFTPPSNDDCSNAIFVANIDTLQSIVLDNRGALESLDATCDNSTDDNFDLWYSFTMPFDGKVKFSGISVISKLAIYDQCGGTELGCQAGIGFIEGLTGGLTYILRYNTASQYAAANTIYLQAFPQPTNDSCNTAIVIPNIAMAQNVVLDTRGGSESLDASCEDPTNDNIDLWYSFNMPFDGKLEVSGVFGFNRIVLYDSCGGTELGCSLSGGFFYALAGGHSYLMRYAALPAQANIDQITVQAFPAPINDECTNAIALSNLASPQTIFLDTREATESLDVSCENAADTNHDLWYSFIMPFDGKLQITQVFGANKLALFDSCGGIEIACMQGNGFFDSLSGGTSYILRYAALASQADADQITVQAFPPDFNDECSNAFEIVGIDSLRNISLDTRQATESLDASCEDASNDNYDLWYIFSMPFAGGVELSNLQTNRRIVLYDSCGTAELGCLAGNGSFYGLDSAAHYVLRYATISASAAVDDFFIQAIAPPANDACSDALAIDSIVLGQRVILDTRKATAAPDAFCTSDSLDQLDLWYTFSMPFDGKVVLSEANPAHYFSLWDSCGGSQIICFSGDSVISGLKADSNYYLRYASSQNLAQEDSFFIQA
ncbi:MAG: hypothetical protein AB8H47_20515, partial [Bacteroidia bacterium]